MPRTTFAIAVTIALCFTACKDNPSSKEQGITNLAVISDLRAYSADSNKVGLVWTATTATNTGYMEHHEITVRTGTQIVQTLYLPNTATGTTVAGLTEGTIYSLSVVVKKNSASPYDDSPAVSISWSPARRFSTDKYSGFPLQLYESNSAGNMHAIRLFAENVNGPRLVSLSSPDRSTMDLYVQSAPIGLLLRSGALYAPVPTGRDAKFSNRIPQEASSLNNAQPFAPTMSSYVLDEVNIPSETVLDGLIFFVRTVDNHCARILVMRGINGKLIEGTAPNRSITIQISYQFVPGVQYAINHAEAEPRTLSYLFPTGW